MLGHRQFSFDEMKLEDSMIFAEIPRHWGFIYRRYGSREATVLADWPNALHRYKANRIGGEPAG